MSHEQEDFKSEYDGVSLETKLALMVKDIHSIKTNTKEIKDSLQSQYVTRNEFNPVKSIVYGMVGVILLAVLGALVALVVGQSVKQPVVMSNGVLR